MATEDNGKGTQQETGGVASEDPKGSSAAGRGNAGGELKRVLKWLAAAIPIGAATVGVAGGFIASVNYIWPKAILEWYVEKPNVSTGLDPDISLVAVNRGNAIVILGRRGELCFASTCTSLLLRPRPEHAVDRVLGSGESVTMTLNNSTQIDLPHQPTQCELRYGVRYPPSAKLVRDAYKFSCWKDEPSPPPSN